MFYREVCKRICKICALVAATLILPVLAYADAGRASGPGNDNARVAFAGRDNGTGNNGKNNGKQYGHDNVPVVPEVNPVWVLLPFSGAVLLLSWRRFSCAKT
jgi:hypothetical protein